MQEDSEEILLQDYTGQSYATVKLRLEELGFQCRAILEENREPERAGKISAMITQPERSYKKGTEIYVRVWSEVQTEEPSAVVITVVPDSTGA